MYVATLRRGLIRYPFLKTAKLGYFIILICLQLEVYQARVVSHLEHVIVAGEVRPTAEDDDPPVVQDDVEILNWIENSHWRKVAIH